MGVRLYNPAAGRFLSVDPVVGGGANAYEYCLGDPVNCRDLDGRAALFPDPEDVMERVWRNGRVYAIRWGRAFNYSKNKSFGFTKACRHHSLCQALRLTARSISANQLQREGKCASIALRLWKRAMASRRRCLGELSRRLATFDPAVLTPLDLIAQERRGGDDGLGQFQERHMPRTHRSRLARVLQADTGWTYQHCLNLVDEAVRAGLLGQAWDEQPTAMAVAALKGLTDRQVFVSTHPHTTPDASDLGVPLRGVLDGPSGPDNDGRGLAEMLGDARGGPLEYQGQLLRMMFELPVVDGAVLTFTRRTGDFQRPQGLHLKVLEGHLEVAGQRLNDIVLWSDTASEVVNAVARAQHGSLRLRVWNVWRDALGTMQAWIGNAALTVEQLPDGAFLLRCSDGFGEPNFSNLEVDMAVIPPAP